jgi:hypothetical protein
MRGTPESTRECGFTLVETLVMLAITAMMATLLSPLSSEGVRDNFRLADRTLVAGEQSVSEAEYRNLLRRAVPPLLRPDGSVADKGLVGVSTALQFPVEGEPSLACPGITGYRVVQLRVERRRAGGGRLLCDGASGTRQLLEWDRGEASFSYSPDGVSWVDAWPARRRRGATPDTSAPPLVRMSLRQGRVLRLLWIERAGDPALMDPAVVGREYDPALRGTMRR